MNRFLERRIVKDKRNPYGSRGGYVMPNRRDRMMKEPYYDDMEDTYPSRPTRDYRGYDYNYDMNYRDYSSVDKEYKQDLKLINKVGLFIIRSTATLTSFLKFKIQFIL